MIVQGNAAVALLAMLASDRLVEVALGAVPPLQENLDKFLLVLLLALQLFVGIYIDNLALIFQLGFDFVPV